MSKPPKHEAVDNWMGGIVLALLSIGLYIANLVNWQNPWLYELCTFSLGMAVIFAYFGIKQEILIRQAKQEAEKAKTSVAEEAH